MPIEGGGGLLAVFPGFENFKGRLGWHHLLLKAITYPS
jgi:hypothetical protein